MLVAFLLLGLCSHRIDTRKTHGLEVRVEELEQVLNIGAVLSRKKSVRFQLLISMIYSMPSFWVLKLKYTHILSLNLAIQSFKSSNS